MRASGEATRQRILEAARREFSQHGLAGARINRIATTARASKERLYAYFPNKEALFAAVAEQLVSSVTDEAVFRGDDLPGYVGALFDIYTKDPDTVRLHDWFGLQTSGDVEDGSHESKLQSKVDAIRAAQRAGHVDPAWNPVDLLLLLISIARSLAIPHALSTSLAQFNGGATDTATRRHEAIQAARRLVNPV